VAADVPQAVGQVPPSGATGPGYPVAVREGAIRTAISSGSDTANKVPATANANDGPPSAMARPP
jgi:hypothetical protein